MCTVLLDLGTLARYTTQENIILTCFMFLEEIFFVRISN